mgnify:CR=1 FL=1
MKLRTRSGRLLSAIGLGAVLSGERSLYWKLTARENLEYFAALYHVPAAETRRRVCDGERAPDRAAKVGVRRGATVSAGHQPEPHLPDRLGDLAVASGDSTTGDGVPRDGAGLGTPPLSVGVGVPTTTAPAAGPPR